MGKKGKGKGTKGKDYYGSKGSKGYRSPGKVVGKGLNYWGEDEYTAAWGNEVHYYYKYDEWDYTYGDMNHVGNQMMFLEHHTTTTNKTKHQEKTRDELTITILHMVTGTIDPLKRTQRPTPISTQNKYSALGNEDDSDDEDDDVLGSDDIVQPRERKFYNPNRRQRRQYRRQQAHDHHNKTDDQSEEFEEVQSFVGDVENSAKNIANNIGIHHNRTITLLWRRSKPGDDNAHMNDENVRDAVVRDGCASDDWQVFEECTWCKNNVAQVITIHNNNHNLHHNETCTDDHDNDNSWFKSSVHVGHYNHWLKDGGFADPHCATPWSSSGSGVTCSCSSIRRPSSQGRRVNWSKSSGLLVEFVSHLGLVSNPHEWDPRGADGREVMSLANATPMEQLLAPRPSNLSARVDSCYSAHGRPERLVASEYIGTCASGYIRGTRGIFIVKDPRLNCRDVGVSHTPWGARWMPVPCIPDW